MTTLRSEQVAVAVYRVSRIKLRGHVLSFDLHAMLLKNSPPRIACKHAISAVLPARMGNVPTTHASA